MYSKDSKNNDESSKKTYNEDLFNTTAWLYSEGQLSTEIAAKSTGLTIEEFLDRYEDYKG
jgi:hypothetical protein